MNNTRRMGLALALATACISGVSLFLNANYVKSYANPTVYTTAKNIVAALVLGAMVLAGSRAGARLTRPRGKSQWAGLAAVAVVGGSVAFVLFFEGLAKATEDHPASQAQFIHKTLVIWVAILAVAFLREKFTWVHGAAIAFLLVGQVGINGGVSPTLSALQHPGALMVFGATLLWAGEVAISKRLLVSLSPWTLSIARMAGGTVILVGWSFIQGTAGTIPPQTGVQWVWVLLTGLLLAGYVATWHNALARAQAVDVTAVLVFAVFVTAALNGAFEHVSLAPNAVWYGAITLGTGLLGWQMLRKRPLLAVGAPA
jgi:drug/metabolite transporter (DMT)-like permease